MKNNWGTVVERPFVKISAECEETKKALQCAAENWDRFVKQYDMMMCYSRNEHRDMHGFRSVDPNLFKRKVWDERSIEAEPNALWRCAYCGCVRVGLRCSGCGAPRERGELPL